MVWKSMMDTLARKQRCSDNQKDSDQAAFFNRALDDFTAWFFCHVVVL
jgi:hypothetical protein